MVPNEGGINRNVLAKDSHSRAYIFSSCNEKVRTFVVLRTTRTKKEIVMKSITCTSRMVTWETIKAN